MKRFTLFLLTALFAAPIFSDIVPPSAESDRVALVQAQNQFSLRLLSELTDGRSDRNLVVSGRSIHEALSMVMMGARGKTSFEMERALNVEPLGARTHTAYGQLAPPTKTEESSDFILHLANAGFLQKGFPLRAEYTSGLEQNYHTEFISTDFQKSPDSSRKTINRWVEGKTEQKIKNLIQPAMLDRSTRWVLANAAYFKATWQNPFEKKFTKKGTFHSPKRKLTVPFMDQTKEFPYYEDTNFRAVTLPYRDGRATMTFLMPKQKSAVLDATGFNDLKGKMNFKRIRLRVPKFRLETTRKLGTVLKEMGMTLAFSPNADFSGITTSKGLAISDVVHKAFISVDEYGTEAAAATAVMMYGTAMTEENPADAIFDRPFYFFIEEADKKSPLFTGRVVQP